jgi:three-Cys-motif partner protein
MSAPTLFDIESIPSQPVRRKYKNLTGRIWTETKAKLIERYLQYFVFITKHGTYLDAFAGPQNQTNPDSWAARLVLRSKPKRLRHFVLFEKNARSVQALKSMVDEEADKRDIQIISGDSNTTLPAYLEENKIPGSEATFCLLDQRTFECDWATVEKVAGHKTEGNKIELFYFFAQGWIDRSVNALKCAKDVDMQRWWGNDRWIDFMKLARPDRGREIAERFKRELGYKHAFSYPILETPDGSRIMFYMVHASDHNDAPVLMTRAYNNAYDKPDQTLMPFVKNLVLKPKSKQTKRKKSVGIVSG